MSNYIGELSTIAIADVDILKEKDKHYGGSWKKRGGVGAYMMLARKWDRIEEFVEKHFAHNVFAAVAEDKRTDTIMDDIQDLRRYLMLVEGECRARGYKNALNLPIDKVPPEEPPDPLPRFDNAKREQPVVHPGGPPSRYADGVEKYYTEKLD